MEQGEAGRSPPSPPPAHCRSGGAAHTDGSLATLDSASLATLDSAPSLQPWGAGSFPMMLSPHAVLVGFSAFLSPEQPVPCIEFSLF